MIIAHPSTWLNWFRQVAPGLLIAGVIALASQFISDQYGAPVMLMALLFGLALNFLSEEKKCQQGIAFSAKPVLRFGVALLGTRISFEMIDKLGIEIIAMVIAGIALTILFGLLVAKLLRLPARFAFLSAGSVAICGVSAAIAISSVIPKNDDSEKSLVFTVVSVTILSTFAMIFYPVIANLIGYSDQTSGVFLGATIHDVAQVVGAGFSISQETGEVSTFVKLFRVAMLAPVVLAGSLCFGHKAFKRSDSQKKPALIPGFLMVFIVLMIANSFHIIPRAISEIAFAVSRWALLTAIAAVGLKTSIKEIVKVGFASIFLITLETFFLAVFIIYILSLIR